MLGKVAVPRWVHTGKLYEVIFNSGHHSIVETQIANREITEIANINPWKLLGIGFDTRA